MARTLDPSRPLLPVRGVTPACWEEAHAICAEARRRSGSSVASLAFSGGKDSLCCWLVMRDHFDQVVPVYWYLVPGLPFVERSLAYYEQVFSTPIMRLPHPDRWDLLAYWAYQTPSRLTGLREILADVPRYTMDQLMGELKAYYNIEDSLHAVGIRATDTPQRRTIYRKHGGFSPSKPLFYPIISWGLDEIEAAIWSSGLALSEDYTWYGRSYDGIMYRYTEAIRHHDPAAWRRILRDFPLAELEQFRARKMDVERTALTRVGGAKAAARRAQRGWNQPPEEVI